jgi:hypothetical protein
MASHLQNNFIRDMSLGNLIPGTHVFRMLLTSSSYTPSKAHDRRDEITNELATGSGYTAKGNQVTMTVSTDQPNNRTSISFSAPSWANASFTARYGVVYRDRGGTSADDEVMAVLDFTQEVTTTNGTFTTNEIEPFYINN